MERQESPAVHVDRAVRTTRAVRTMRAVRADRAVGTDRTDRTVRAVEPARPPLLLTSRRHIDLLRVCSAANSPR
ncbi:hypothetical protein ABZX93_27035 [Streptomyces sp. NPDC006632]|uniref:hypothetical protein n=1 Tax=Streptomyces sp. NPDC006632 TaxID=3157182 RepID=UPI0033B47C41